ncbi:Variant-specific surface protein, partial [Giardia duodenalis]
VCREARGGACVGHAEEARAETKEQLGAGTCEEVTGNEPNTCKTCGAVIGGTKYCSACNVDSNTASAPVDGQCTTENNECPQKANGMCTQCAHESFMFQGGCYSKDAVPGNTMCETTDSAGVCTQAKQGYFVPPGADNAHQSVISCADETPVVLASNKQYKDVANCLKCTKPADGTPGTPMAAACDECAPGYFKNGAACTQYHSSCLTCSAAGGSGCKSCKDGYFLGATTNTAGKCIKCDNVDDTNWKGVMGCLKCTTSGAANTPATCTECQADRYLKAKVGDTAETCETKETCTGGYFPKDESTGGNKCVQCSSASDGGITDCGECSLFPHK